MNVTYTDRAKQWGEAFVLLQQATKRLEEILGPSAGLVRAEWDRTEDARGRPLYTLRIADWAGSVSATFTPAELRDSEQMHYCLVRLWGDLLQVRSHKQLEELTGAAGPGGG
jgi:hypothetical protein